MNVMGRSMEIQPLFGKRFFRFFRATGRYDLENTFHGKNEVLYIEDLEFWVIFSEYKNYSILPFKWLLIVSRILSFAHILQRS